MMFGDWKSGTVRFWILLCDSRDCFASEHLRYKAIEALRHNGQTLAHVLDGLGDLLVFMLALTGGIFFQGRLRSREQIAKNRSEFPANSVAITPDRCPRLIETLVNGSQ